MRAHPRRSRALLLDAATIKRHLAPAHAYAMRGADQARAALSQRDTTLTRVVATRAAQTGQVCFRRAQRIMIATLVQFYHAIRATYPDAATIDVVQDHWSAARQKWGRLRLPIQIVPLPTSASWGHPIEQLRRLLRQTVPHLHRWADDLPRLREEVDRFRSGFAGGSTDLLRYVGLSTGLNS